MSEQRNQYRGQRRKQTSTPESDFVETILKGLWYLVSLPFKGKGKASSRNVPVAVAQELAGHWPTIELHVSNPNTLGLAVSEADKLFDAAMQAAAIPGDTMGERLRAAKGYFPEYMYQQIWDAHKLRNAVAHEVGVQLNYEQTRAAIDTFRAALMHLGVLI